MHTQSTNSARREQPGAHARGRGPYASSDDPHANPSLHTRRPPSTRLLVAGLVIGAVLLLLPVGSEAVSGAPGTAGAYCPIPEPGETPSCQVPAREQYGEFFAAVESGRADPAQTTQIEAALSRTGDETGAYLALSSIAYGYYRLAHEASQQPHANPRLTARLMRWNELLTRVYGAESTPPALKAAVRTAAEDLGARVPPIGVTCTAGREADCEAVRGLVGALAAIDERTSMRSPLSRLGERLLGPADRAFGAPSQER